MASSTQHSAKETEIVSYDPATGDEIGRAEITSADGVRQAVASARTAYAAWRKTSFDQRGQFVMAARKVIIAEMDEIALLILRETGKPLTEAISMEIAPVLDLMQYFASHTEGLLAPRKIPLGLYTLLGRFSQIIYKPWGVVGIIPAWNYPFSIPLGEAVMALMAGNTVVIKPAELTSLTGLRIGEIFERAGLPKDVVQIVTGDGETGAALVEAAPEKIMFTGSVATGKKIAKAAAENLTSVVLELGGKDAMVVFEDANLELAAEAAVWGAFCNAGQSCSSVERLYVHKDVAEELTHRIVEKTRRLKVGSGKDDDTSIGAMSSERQVKIVEDHVEAFRAAGAKIEIGGERHGGDTLFYEPTVISGATNEMKGMRDETFGPTLPIALFSNEDEAVTLANDSEFGLTASVWTRDYSRGRRVAARLDAGTVCINEVLYTHGIGQTPWGGSKNSGRGRTHGLEGLMELVQPQHIHTNRIALVPDAWWFPYTPSARATFKKLATTFASGSLFKTVTLLPQLVARIRELLRSR